jgi:hypothetical protein
MEPKEDAGKYSSGALYIDKQQGLSIRRRKASELTSHRLVKPEVRPKSGPPLRRGRSTMTRFNHHKEDSYLDLFRV